eukprot:TRINITY_DN15142_c0_g1_i2.p1 TRINITY_DN15142_c0_g1~~TRINITY_DN15142_c0_g1_i2.p1  ORF type:complete len:258 (-),score=19.71 TRINITY_DN15142_c0_g1_i2:65-838(-)
MEGKDVRPFCVINCLFTLLALLNLIDCLTPPSTPPRGRRRSNSDHSRWGEVFSNSEDFVQSMTELVYHSIPLNELPVMRKIRAQTDSWCQFNPTLMEDLTSLLTLRAVKTFITTVVQKLKLESEIQVMSTVFLDRLLAKGLILHCGNWKPVLLAVSMVACKAYDDKAVYNNDFVDCQKGLTPSILLGLEHHLLKELDFNVNLKLSDYQLYLFELRHLQGVGSPLKSPVFIKNGSPSVDSRKTRSSNNSPTRSCSTSP